MGVQSLWAAVVERALLDASEPGVYQRPAVQWLMGNGSTVAMLHAGVNPDAVRETLLSDPRYDCLQRAYRALQAGMPAPPAKPSTPTQLPVPANADIRWMHVGDAIRHLHTSSRHMAMLIKAYRIPTFYRGKLKLVSAAHVHALPQPLPSRSILHAMIAAAQQVQGW